MNAMNRIEAERAEAVGFEAPQPAAPGTAAPAVSPAPVAPVPMPVAPEPVVTAAPPAPAAAPKRRRRPGRFVLMAVVPLGFAVGGAYWWVTGGRFEETDNAYLHQPRITVASETAGRVVAANVGENAPVRAGDVLFAVDPEPYRIALAQADAALAAARTQVGQLRAAYGQAQAQAQAAVNDVNYFRSELERQQALSGKGIATGAALDAARRELNKAEDAGRAADQAVAGALAALGGNPAIRTDEHPGVLAALAARDKAAFDLAQTTVRAPADGIIAQAASFKPGQYVTAGTGLFSLVETGDTWVDANFKETQLTNMQLGQKAEIEFDAFPGRPVGATVESIGAGTGAEFSLLPAQNATGNWVKVTQRVPVRLRLDAPEARLLLRSGMSADVSLDTGHARGLPDWAKGIAATLSAWAPATAAWAGSAGR
jgi:membrane fusion protein, multidrug efflux system